MVAESFVEFEDRKTVANMVEEYSKRLHGTMNTGNEESRKLEANSNYKIQGNSRKISARKQLSSSPKTQLKGKGNHQQEKLILTS